MAHLAEVDPRVPVWLNRHWVDADFRITTGFVEPHFFAGFSGGPKLVAPGLVGFRETPEALLDMICAPGHNHHDQWEVQVQAQIQQRAEVFLKTDGLGPDEVRAAHLTPIDDVAETTREQLDRAGPARGCASCPRDRRRFRTWPGELPRVYFRSVFKGGRRGPRSPRRSPRWMARLRAAEDPAGLPWACSRVLGR